MEMIGFAVLLGIATGYLWGDYLANKKANKRLEFWRNAAAMAKTEAEFMVKELAEVTAQREAASARADDMLCQIEAYKTRADHAEYRTAAQKQQFERLENEKNRCLSQVQGENARLRDELRREQDKNSEEAKERRRNKQAAARKARENVMKAGEVGREP